MDELADSNRERWEALVPFPDGGTITSYLPVLLARRFLAGELRAVGLVTPLDLLDRDELLGELEELGWGLEIRPSHFP